VSRPPPDTVEVLNVALVLLATSSNKRIAGSIECNKKGLPRDLGWRSCVRMMNETTDMMIAMKNYNPDIWNGHVRAANMAAAEDMIAKLGPRFAPQYVSRLTSAGSHIAAGDETMSLELENSAPLSLYAKCLGPDCKQIAVSLLVNIEPAISALEGAPLVDRSAPRIAIQIEAVEALKVLGARHSERSLKALAPRLVSHSADLRKAVLSAIQQGWSSDDEECAAVLVNASPQFSTDVEAPRQEALEALMHFHHGHPDVVGRILAGLNVGEDAAQLVSLAYFERVAVSADAESLVAGTLQHMFEEGRDWIPSTRQVILRALEVAASRSYDGVRLGLLKHLTPTRGHGILAASPPDVQGKECHGPWKHRVRVKLSNFRIIANGFRRQNSRIRHVYSQAFERLICFGEGRAAAAVLIEVIQQDLFDWSRIIAAELLPRAVGPKEDSDALLAILLLLNDSSVMCKLASLHSLLAFTPRPFPDEVTEAAERHLRHEDEGIRLAALLVLEHIHGIEFFPEKLGRCLRDPVSNVVQSAVQLLAVLLERGKGTEQALAALPPLLTHGDWAVRQAAVSALGQVQDLGASIEASELLRARPVWPETNRMVLEVKQKALELLDRRV
ncbi:ift122, partial [Symbiodinium microadriaticum]